MYATSNSLSLHIEIPLVVGSGDAMEVHACVGSFYLVHTPVHPPFADVYVVLLIILTC